MNRTNIVQIYVGADEIQMYEQDPTNLPYEKLKNEYFDSIKNVLSRNNHIPYFVTVSFVDIATNDTNQKIKFVFEQYDRFYRHLISQLMNNYTRKLHLHPRTFDFIDFPNTRHSNSSYIPEHKTPHIHSVYLVHRDTQSKFEQHMREDFDKIVQHRNQRYVIQAYAERIRRSNADLDQVLSYSMKLLETHSKKHLTQENILTQQYPISTSQLYQRVSKHDQKHVDPRPEMFEQSKQTMRESYSRC
jgi:hypothetical protein